MLKSLVARCALRRFCGALCCATQRNMHEKKSGCENNRRYDMRANINKAQRERAARRNFPLKCTTHEQTDLDDSASGRSDTRPKVGALLGNGAGDGGTLDFTLGVDDDTRVV